MNLSPLAVTAYIALGANLGNARVTVLQAMQSIATLRATCCVHCSSLYRTAPIDAVGPDYINAVVEVLTCLMPQDLLFELQQLEQTAGRQRSYRNAPRTLDLDILLYGDACLQSTTLVIPHPRMKTRAFVLLPLAEIAPAKVSVDDLQAVSDQRITRLNAD